MIKIITFLGANGARNTQYNYQESIYEGGVFAEVLHQFCTYDEMLVCVTDVAKEKTFPVLEKLGDPRIKAIDIPTGRTTDEMWETFQIITNHISEGDQVIFDITHGLRSLPFLAFLFAAYLKTAKNVTIQAIYYGAFELGNPAPVVELSEFVGMLDWIAATDRFVKVGDGLPLADLLKNAIPSNLEAKNNPAVRPIRDQLRKAMEAITDISQALSLTRPLETLKSTVELEDILQEADLSFEQRAKPFSLVSDKVIQEYGQFALRDAMQEDHLARNLWLQFQMVSWYQKRGQVVQAMTLAREWLVSVTAYRLGVKTLLDKNSRFSVESALHNGNAKIQNKKPKSLSSFDEAFEKLPEFKEVCQLWDKLTEIRNDIAHVGMNESPASAQSLKNRAEGVLPELEQVARIFLDSEI
ncbi:MAG: TIGR02221 family CRISPR-associated protein [Snowella sp.]|nr:TIGR02221 family CRISPR-associated protein [Snowella sp.]